MWEKRPKKTLYTLNIGNYAPDVLAITFPLMKHWARKIGAEFHVIDSRAFPEHYHVTYEKFQIYELAQKHDNDWNIYLDADALVHPEMFDPTEFIPRDTVAHHGKDMANVRWKYDRVFRRDGRHIGSGNWLAIASSWCIELWKPLEDITYEEAVRNITITVNEANTVIKPDHLIDDYTCSRNIATYGLRFTTVTDICTNLGWKGSPYFWHQYTFGVEEKVMQMKKVLKEWGIA